MTHIYYVFVFLLTICLFLLIVGDTSLESVICDDLSLKTPSHSIVIGDCNVPPGEPTSSLWGEKTDTGIVRMYASCILQVC